MAKQRKQSPAEKRKAYMKAYRKSYDKHRVAITLSSSEYKDFKRLADKEDIPLATLVKNMALAYLQSETFVPSEIEEQLKEANRLFRNVANNVNQVAHRSNMGSSVDINEILAYIKQLDSLVREHTLKKLGGL